MTVDKSLSLFNLNSPISKLHSLDFCLQSWCCLDLYLSFLRQPQAWYLIFVYHQSSMIALLLLAIGLRLKKEMKESLRNVNCWWALFFLTHLGECWMSWIRIAAKRQVIYPYQLLIYVLDSRFGFVNFIVVRYVKLFFFYNMFFWTISGNIWNIKGKSKFVLLCRDMNHLCHMKVLSSCTASSLSWQ